MISFRKSPHQELSLPDVRNVDWEALHEAAAAPNGKPKKRGRWAFFRSHRANDPTAKPRPMWLGNQLSGAPYILPENALKVGGYIEGAPGSGKTTALATMLAHVIRNVHRKPQSVVVVDLKADPLSNELFHALRLEAKAAGIPFKWCSITDTSLDDRPSFGFNPLAMEFWARCDTNQRAAFLRNAGGLSYGIDYAKMYYSLMIAGLSDYERQRFPESVTFRQISRAVSRIVNTPLKEQRKLGLHPEYVRAGIAYDALFKSLASPDVLNVAPGGNHPIDVVDHRIDFADAFRHPCVYFFSINTTLGGIAAAIAGRFIPFALQYTSQLCSPQIPVLTAFDEVQTIASYSMQNCLNMLRQVGPLILANQSLDDLETSAVDLRKNTKNLGFYWRLSINDEQDQEKCSQTSGHVTALRASMTGRPTIGGMFAYESFSLHEERAPYVELNEVKALSADPEWSLITCKLDDPDIKYNGLPVRIKRIPRPDLAQYARLPFPTNVVGTFVPARPPVEIDPELPDLAGPVPALSINENHRERFQLY